MRNNQPVTNRGVELGEHDVIVSQTDVKGRIAFINDDFIRISGFEEAELIRQPHNIVRHPDMPTEAFEDLWRDLKAGLPWSGLVKNRTKQGDYYWVQADVVPRVENGQTVGYQSVRTKPADADVKAAHEAYRTFREGRAAGMGIEHGQLVGTTRSARLRRWLGRFEGKLACVMAGLCLMMMLVAATGMVASQRAAGSIQLAQEQHVVPLGGLAALAGEVRSVYARLGLVAAGAPGTTTLIADAERAIGSIETAAAKLADIPLSGGDKALAEAEAAHRRRFLDEAAKPALALAKAGRIDDMKALLFARQGDFAALDAGLTRRLEAQVASAARTAQQSRFVLSVGLGISLAALLLGLAGAFFGQARLRRFFAGRLAYLDSRLASIAGGDLRTRIETGHDELRGTLVTVRALQATLAYAEREKAQLERQKREIQLATAADFERSVKSIVDVVASAVTELAHSADSMSASATDSARRVGEATGAAKGASTNVQAVAAAAEELSTSVSEISRQLQMTAELVTQSRDRARNADSLASDLTRASDRVARAMDMISAISGQINLLALNATIESARAGAAGRGFAVVANEVKNLADQTDKTVSEIQAVVVEMRQASQAIVGAIAEIAGSVGSISDAAAGVASAVEQQSATTSEIAHNMQNAAVGTQVITGNLEEVRVASDHAGAASSQILQASRELSNQAETLNSEVESFLSRMRAA